MKILLANINYLSYLRDYEIFPIFKRLILTSFSESLIYSSINLMILSSLTPESYKTEIKDRCRYQDFDFDKDYDLVGLSCTTDSAIEAYKIADEFRRRGKKVVLGGWHPSALPEEAKQHADAVVIGEAEETWPELLNDFENKDLRPFYSQKQPLNPEKIPILNHTKTRKPGIQATRGCPYGCDFCSISHADFGKIFRARPIEDVIKEIKSIKKNSFNFYDNSLTINPSYTKELFKEMKNLNKKFTCYGNVNVLGKDDELLKLASEAGCTDWFVGLESINNDSLNSVGKKNKVEEYLYTTKKIHDYGMMIKGSFVFGFDYDTLDVFDKTIDLVRKCEIDIVYFHVLTPLPGTPIFKKFEMQGRILTKDWSKYNFSNVVFKPKNMTPEQLYDNFKKVSAWQYVYNCRDRSIHMKLLDFYSYLHIGCISLKRRYDHRYLYR